MKRQKRLKSTSIENFLSAKTCEVEDFLDVVNLDRTTLNLKLLTKIFLKVFSKQIDGCYLIEDI
jgi:hypothetical protein